MLGVEPWPASLSSLVVEAVSVLATAEDADPLVLVLTHETDPPRRLAAQAALRSLVHASTLERPQLAVNLVVGGSSADRDRTVGYLQAPDGEFVRGAVIDLGGA
jgi:hypothetical protein